MSRFSAGMHSSCTHWRTRSRTFLASSGISKSMAMAGSLRPGLSLSRDTASRPAAGAGKLESSSPSASRGRGEDLLLAHALAAVGGLLAGALQVGAFGAVEGVFGLLGLFLVAALLDEGALLGVELARGV